MNGFPTVNFGQGDGGLFSPEEIAQLMESEYQRSLRYDYPLALLLAEIDRLDALHDLYGIDSETRILRAVVGLLRSSTRSSDVLGRQRDQRLLVLLPHCPRESAVAVARRLSSGCRDLEFRGDGRVLRASLSIGLVARADEGNLAALVERGEQALAAALAAGGGRFLEYESLPPRPGAMLRPLAVEDPPAPRPTPRPVPPRPAAPVLPALDQIPGATLEEKVRGLLRFAGAPDGEALEREVLAVLQRTVGEVRRPHATREDVLDEIRRLEVRVNELRRLLGASEEELGRMVREKSVDPGMASIFKSVQGLDPAEQNYKKKKELLAVLYEANVELLKELEKQARKQGGG
jgi:diguanylate cyclase (GGDEF)-like protein